jgi:DNA-directed RNA polymerase subunit E'/Rpb7
MSRITVDKKICIEPKFLDSKLLSHIYTRIVDQMVGKCDQNYGYILKVYESITILENSLATASTGVFFNVRFDIKILKPKIKGSYSGIVCMIFQEGIFVEVSNKMKVLIRTNEMDGYKYSKSKNIFKKNDKTISKDDTLDITIEMIKYEKQHFNCIGSLKTTDFY